MNHYYSSKLYYKQYCITQSLFLAQDENKQYGHEKKLDTQITSTFP